MTNNVDQVNLKKRKTEDIISSAVTMLKSTGTKEEMTKQANDYADQVGMNELNRNLLVTLKTESREEFIKKAFQDPHEPGRQMTYAEMRSMYG
jgi:hypothetical protein